MKFANGDSYEGNFKEGRMHEKGKTILMKGLINGGISEGTKEIGLTIRCTGTASMYGTMDVLLRVSM